MVFRNQKQTEPTYGRKRLMIGLVPDSSIPILQMPVLAVSGLFTSERSMPVSHSQDSAAIRQFVPAIEIFPLHIPQHFTIRENMKKTLSQLGFKYHNCMIKIGCSQRVSLTFSADLSRKTRFKT